MLPICAKQSVSAPFAITAESWLIKMHENQINNDRFSGVSKKKLADFCLSGANFSVF